METFVTVADMMAALSVLPADARLVVTESGYYSYSEFAGVCLPKAYIVESGEQGLPRRAQVYRIGHSHQNP